MSDKVNFPLTEHANGVERNGKFYPFKTYFMLSDLGSTSRLRPTTTNQRLFVKAVYFRFRTVAGDTTTFVLVGIKGPYEPDRYLGTVRMNTGVADTQESDISNLGIFLKRDEFLYCNTDAVPTAGTAMIVYAEVDDI